MTIEKVSKDFIHDRLKEHYKKDINRFTPLTFGSHKFVNIFFNAERYLPDMVQVTKQEFSKIVLGE